MKAKILQYSVFSCLLVSSASANDTLTKMTRKEWLGTLLPKHQFTLSIGYPKAFENSVFNYPDSLSSFEISARPEISIKLEYLLRVSERFAIGVHFYEYHTFFRHAYPYYTFPNNDPNFPFIYDIEDISAGNLGLQGRYFLKRKGALSNLLLCRVEWFFFRNFNKTHLSSAAKVWIRGIWQRI
ncbi:MAG: hypothetical protein HY841_12790 [Bacteroidetes bacterium]|nr:hypothetical protein [Bacteroidota bacterium]